MYTKSWTDAVQFRRRGSIGSQTNSATLARAVTGTRTGEAVPDWREKIRQRVDATSPYTLDATRYVSRLPISAAASCRTQSGVPLISSFEGFYQAPDAVSHLTPDFASARNEALGKAYHRLKQAQTHMQGLTTLGEMGEVIRQFRRPFPRIVDYANSHLNRWEKRYSRAIQYKDSRLLDIASDSWLEFSFGIKPLVADAESAAEALARFQEDLSYEKTRFTARAKRTVHRGARDIAVYTDSHIVGTADVSTVTEFSVQYIIAASYAATMTSDTDRLRNLFGVRLDEIVPTAYELLPWSWLLDYFTNTGEILNAYCQSQAGVQFVVRTERTHTVSTYTYLPSSDLTIARLKAYGGAKNFAFMGSRGAIVLERTTLTRAKDAKLAVPSFTWKLPFGNYAKDLNMAAVLMQRRTFKPAASPSGSFF